MTRPPLTVITVVRNGEEVIDACLRSVAAQGIDGLEHIVIDGASTDDTLAIVRSHESSISQIVSEPDNGLYDAMNKGLGLANGRFVHFLNADDRYCADDTLKQILPRLCETEINYGQLIYVHEDGREEVQGAPFSMSRERVISTVPQPTLFVANEIYSTVGGFDLTYNIAADYDMVLRLTSRYPARYIDVPTTRMHAGGVSYRHMEETFREARAVSIRHGRSRIGAATTYWQRRAKWQILKAMPPFMQNTLRSLRGRRWQ